MDPAGDEDRALVSATTHNLPVQLTSFVGRDEEPVELERLVSRRRL